MIVGFRNAPAMRCVVNMCFAMLKDLSLAAIILGVLLNLLEAGKYPGLDFMLALISTVSLGLLIFPVSEESEAFAGLETKGISLFIMRY